MLQLAAPLLAICLPTPELHLGEAGDWNGARFGRAVLALGDVDADGYGDVLVGYDYVARTEVRSGEDGSLLAAFDRVSEDVHPFGDFDGDGRHEVLLTSGTMWELRAAVGGAFVTSTIGAPELSRFHSIGDLIGDVDADSRADVLLTVQTPALRRASQSGSVRLSVLSLAKSGEPLWSIERPLPSPGYEEFCTG